MNSKYSVAVDEPKRDQVAPTVPKDNDGKTSTNKDKASIAANK